MSAGITLCLSALSVGDCAKICGVCFWGNSGSLNIKTPFPILKTVFLLSPTSHTASVGTNMIYARIHHFGGIIRPKQKPHLSFATPNGFAKVKSVTLPARPFLPISPDGQLQSDGDRRLMEVALSALTTGT